MGVGQRARRFPTTRWSLVLAAGGATSSDSRQALDDLCRVYWHPLYSFARSRGQGADAALDLTQGFIADLIHRRDLGKADQDRGPFRSWLLGCFKHYLANQHDHASAQKRGGGQVALSLDAEDAAARYERQLVEGADPETLYLRRWTMLLLERTLAAMRAEVSDQKLERFDKLKPWLVDESDTSFEALGASLGLNANAAKQAVHQLRVKFRERLRAEVAETLDDPEQVDAELRLLIDSLS
jgi:DNA-directed RNA polymerase specialized sigma24 family protein